MTPLTAVQQQARDAAMAMPLDEIDPADPELLRATTRWATTSSGCAATTRCTRR